ncbi:carbohydrate ABC transporter permease [Streptomyces sp. O3]
MTVRSQGVVASAPEDTLGRDAGEAQSPPPPTGPDDVLTPSRGRRRLPTGLLPYLLLAPAIVSLLVLLGYPLLRNLILSFQQVNRKELITRKPKWIGFDNFSELLTDSAFWTVVVRSFVFMGITVLLIMVIGTLLGILLNSLGKAMRLVLSIALLMAWATPIVASVTVFRWLFDEQFGVANWAMRTLGFSGYEQHNWFETGTSALTIIMVLLVWGSVPFVALNMYAGLTTVGAELYEAARMDGAGSTRIFRSVVFPMLRPFFLITTFLEIIWIFKAFAQVYAMNQGGPDGESQTLPVFAYIVGSGQGQYGMAAAISVLTILILVVAMSFYFRLILKEEDEQ